jgi:hypothetical protein
MNDATGKFIAAQRAIAAQRGGTPSPREPDNEPAASPFSIKLSPEQLRVRERADRAAFLNATQSSGTLTRGSGK